MLKKSLIVLILAGVIGMGGIVVQAGTSISIMGSSTVLPVSQRVAEVFMENNPGIAISVSGGGSGHGIVALVDGVVQIANSSRFIKFSEVEAAVKNGVFPVPHRIAIDGIAIIVNKDNPIQSLSLEQLQQIYNGQITDWSQIGGHKGVISVVSRDSASGTYECFNDIVLKGQRLTPRALLQTTSGALVGVVKSTKGAIGYVGMGYLDDSVKAIDIVREDGVTVSPTEENVAIGSYPIARPLFVFTNGWPEGVVAQFLNFILSKEGQDLVREQGFVPLF